MAAVRPGLKGARTDTPPPLVAAEARYEDLSGPVNLVFERFPLPLAGARVLVKPNMLGPYPPEKAVTTHPALVAAVVDRLLAAGARPVVGDNPGARGYGISRRCGEVTGIAAASRGCFANIGEAAAEVDTGSPLGKVRVSRALLEADLVISLPKLKTHVQTVFTGAVKNTYGYLVGGEKSRVHAMFPRSREFSRALAGIFLVRPPDLTIMDAVRAMEGDGPSGGRPRFLGRIIACTDAVAVDGAACRFIGLDPGRVRHLAELVEREPLLGRYAGVGPASLDPVRDFRLPVSVVNGFTSWLANRLVFSFLRRGRLRVRRELCSGCGVCREGCPVGAITMRDSFPVIDRDSCIACYCCHELCPGGAMQMTPALRALLTPGEEREGSGRTGQGR